MVSASAALFFLVADVLKKRGFILEQIHRVGVLSCLTLELLLGLTISALGELIAVLLVTLLGVAVRHVAVHVTVLGIAMLLLIAAAHCVLALHDLKRTQYNTFCQQLGDHLINRDTLLAGIVTQLTMKGL